MLSSCSVDQAQFAEKRRGGVSTHDYLSRNVARERLRKSLETACTRIFSGVKTDTSGEASCTDILELLPKVQESFEKEQVPFYRKDFEEMVGIMDQDGSGGVDKGEFSRGILQLAEGIQPISIIEIRCDVSWLKGQVAQCIQKLNKNNSELAEVNLGITDMMQSADMAHQVDVQDSILQGVQELRGHMRDVQAELNDFRSQLRAFTADRRSAQPATGQLPVSADAVEIRSSLAQLREELRALPSAINLRSGEGAGQADFAQESLDRTVDKWTVSCASTEAANYATPNSLAKAGIAKPATVLVEVPVSLAATDVIPAGPSASSTGAGRDPASRRPLEEETEEVVLLSATASPRPAGAERYRTAALYINSRAGAPPTVTVARAPETVVVVKASTAAALPSLSPVPLQKMPALRPERQPNDSNGAYSQGSPLAALRVPDFPTSETRGSPLAALRAPASAWQTHSGVIGRSEAPTLSAAVSPATSPNNVRRERTSPSEAFGATDALRPFV